MSVRLSGSDKLNLLDNLTTMLGAGITLSATVQTLLEESKGSQKTLLTSVLADITAGKTLSVSFSQFDHIFDDVSINLLKAAEEAGTLEQTLADLQHTLRKDMEFADKVKGALFYPSMVIVVFFAVLIMILVVVMPKIAQVFGQMKMPLPLVTRVMIGLSRTTITQWPWILGVITIFGIIFYFAWREQKEKVLRVIFRMPGINVLAKEIDITRFSRSLHLLLSSGLPIISALKLSADVIVHPELKKWVVRAMKQANAGNQFSSGLRGKGSPFPGLVVRIMDVGERTGTLDKAMLNISDHMDEKVTKTLQKITMMMEPILLILVGLAVGAMMMAIIGPIYGMIGSLTNR